MFSSKHVLIHTSKSHRLLSSSSSALFASPTHLLPIQSLVKTGIPLTLSALNQHLLYLCLNRRFNSAVHFFLQIASYNNRLFVRNLQTPSSILAIGFLQCHEFRTLAHFLGSQFRKIPHLHLPLAQIWDSLIMSLCHKDLELALSLLKECLRNHCKPCFNTFRKLIVGFGARGDANRAIEVLELMNDANVEHPLDSFVVSFIIARFCEIGELQLAIEFFQRADSLGKLVPNLVTYTAVVNVYCLLGRVDDVGRLFSRMESEGIMFDVVFYTSWMVGYFRQGFLRDGICKYGQMLESGIEPDAVCYSVLIDGFCKGGNVEKAIGLLDRMRKDGAAPNLLTFTSIMSAFCKKRKFEEALSTYKIVKALEIPVDEVAYATLLDGACELGKFEEAFEILNEFRKSSISSIECYHCIIHGLCRKGMVGMATDLFMELSEENIILDIGTYMILVKAVLKEKGAAEVLNLIHIIETLPLLLFGTICSETIVLLCKRGVTDTAFSIYIIMANSGLVPSSRAYYSILRGLITEGEQQMTPLLLNKYVKGHGLTDILVDKILVHFLCMKDETSAIKFLRSLKDDTKVTIPTVTLATLSQNGRALDAYNLVKEVENKLPVMDVVDSSIMIDGLCKEGYINNALDLCHFLKKHGISPNIAIYNSILHALCQEGCLVEAFRLFDSFERLNLDPSVVTYSILIDASCKEGAFFKAEWLLGRMTGNGVTPNVRTFNSLIDGYCKFGLFEKAFELYHDMKNKGLKPDSFTISAVISGFDLKGDMQGALDFYVEIKRIGESPDFLGFLYLIRGLLTKGRMEEARSILKEMLQTKSVRDSINQVDAEIETESIGSFLVDLCDRGCIREAVTILDEVGCMLFPLGVASTHKQKMLRAGTGGSATPTVTMSSPNIVRKHSQLQDFNHFYPAIASFCLERKLQNANNLVKQMLQRFSVGQDRSTEYKLS